MGYYYTRLSNKYKGLAGKINSLDKQQRYGFLIIGVFICVCFGLLLNYLIIGKTASRNQQKITALQKQIDAKNKYINQKEQTLSSDDNKMNILNLKKTQEAINKIKQQIVQNQAKQSNTNNVVKIMKNVLSKNNELKLKVFKSSGSRLDLGVLRQQQNINNKVNRMPRTRAAVSSGARSGIVNSKQNADNKLIQGETQRKYYQLTIEGKYLQVYKFLKNIDKKGLNVYWLELDYQVVEAPMAKVEISFYL